MDYKASNKLARIKPLSTLASRWHSDWRRIPYDLMLLVPYTLLRNIIAKIIAIGTTKTPSFQPSPNAQRMNQQIREQGFTLDLLPIEEKKLEEIITYFKNTLCHDTFRPQLGRFPYDKPASEETNMGFYALKDILLAPYILDLLNDPDVLAAAELYLGCKPLLDNIDAWWSYGDRQQAKGTQRYHRDFDSYRGFKQFIYLTDVGLESGPHQYIKGSHQIDKLCTGKACTDEEVHQTFGVDKLQTMTGPAGTRFIADTYGFHKGCLPISGNRLIIVAQYNINRTPHGPKKPPLETGEKTAHYDPYVNQLLIDKPSSH